MPSTLAGHGVWLGNCESIIFNKTVQLSYDLTIPHFSLTPLVFFHLDEFKMHNGNSLKIFTVFKLFWTLL